MAVILFSQKFRPSLVKWCEILVLKDFPFLQPTRISLWFLQSSSGTRTIFELLKDRLNKNTNTESLVILFSELINYHNIKFLNVVIYEMLKPSVVLRSFASLYTTGKMACTIERPPCIKARNILQNSIFKTSFRLRYFKTSLFLF